MLTRRANVYWRRMGGVACLLALLPGCKNRYMEQEQDQGNNKEAPGMGLGFRLGESIKTHVSVRGYQSDEQNRREWSVFTTFGLRVGRQRTGGDFLAQDDLAVWSGTYPPSTFAAPLIMHAVPRVMLDSTGYALGISEVAELVGRVQKFVDTAGTRLEDGAAIMRLASNAPELNVSLHRFWNYALLAHQRAFAPTLDSIEKARIRDPQLGPNALVTIRATRTQIPCPAGAEGDCTSIEMNLQPDKVTLAEANTKLMGFFKPAPGARVIEYHVEDTIRLVARNKDLRTLEMSSERRSTLTWADPTHATYEIQDLEERKYRFD